MALCKDAICCGDQFPVHILLGCKVVVNICWNADPSRRCSGDMSRYEVTCCVRVTMVWSRTDLRSL